jgi:uncharacterized protein YktB (UPF0637 family)
LDFFVLIGVNLKSSSVLIEIRTGLRKLLGMLNRSLNSSLHLYIRMTMFVHIIRFASKECVCSTDMDIGFNLTKMGYKMFGW